MSLKVVTQETSKTTSVTTNDYSTQINTVALTDAAQGTFQFTINCDKLYDDAYPQFTVLYAGTTGEPVVRLVSRTRFSCVVAVRNVGTAALNAALGIIMKVQPN